MKNLLCLLVIVLSSQNILAETCPKLSGVYMLNVNSCQIQGDGSNPALISSELRIQNLSQSTFPNGVRVYVYSASEDNCQYISLMSNPIKGQVPYLDNNSYDDLQGKLPPNLHAVLTGLYNGDWDAYKKNEALQSLGISEGGLQLGSFQQASDGSITAQLPGYVNQPSGDNGNFGIHVTSTYSASVVIQTSGDLLVSASMQTRGFKFGIIPVNVTDATSCVLQKIE